MSESSYQAKIIKQKTKEGWFCIRLLQTNKNGIADWLLAKRGSKGETISYLIEFKAKGEEPDPLQEYRHREIELKTGIKTIVMVEP